MMEVDQLQGIQTAQESDHSAASGDCGPDSADNTYGASGSGGGACGEDYNDTYMSTQNECLVTVNDDAATVDAGTSHYDEDKTQVHKQTEEVAQQATADGTTVINKAGTSGEENESNGEEEVGEAEGVRKLLEEGKQECGKVAGEGRDEEEREEEDEEKRDGKRRKRRKRRRREGHCYMVSGSNPEEGAAVTTTTTTKKAAAVKDINFNLAEVLRYYRRRPRSSSSSDSCSCESCDSSSDESYFSTEEGPPGGETTKHRKAAVFFHSVKYLWMLVVGVVVGVLGVLLGVGLWLLLTADRHKDQHRADYQRHTGMRLVSWTAPLLGLVVVGSGLWLGAWRYLVYKGFSKGEHIEDRRSIIRMAQSKGLVYTIRGAIYAPTRLKGNLGGPANVGGGEGYQVVAYDSEFDTDQYFDSDLEEDGQYRRNLTPWKEIEEPARRKRHNIYTRQAWYRDIPLIWWELWNQPPRDL